MKKFTYTCIAAFVMCSVSAYATNDEELVAADPNTPTTFDPTNPPSINIPNAVIEAEKKEVIPEGTPLPKARPVVNTEESGKKVEETIETIETIDANPNAVNGGVNISDGTIAREGKSLKTEKGTEIQPKASTLPELDTNDPTPEKDRFTVDNPPPENYEPNISDEEMAKEGKLFSRETDPLPPLSVKTELPEKETGFGTDDPVPVAERFTEERQPPKDYKVNISDDEIIASGKGVTFELPLEKDNIISSTETVVSSVALGANVAIDNIGSRLSGNRSNDNISGSTASLGGMISPVVEKSGLWVNSKYTKTQRHSVKLKNWGMQIGYDHPFQLESAVLRLGFAADLGKGTGGIKNTDERLTSNQHGVTIYGSYETETKHYVDFFLRTARSSIKWTDSSKFHNNSYTVALAYSKLIDVSNALSLEPSVKLSYSHVSGTHFVKNNYPVYLEPMNIMVGNVGLKGIIKLNGKLAAHAKVELNKELLGKTKGNVGSTYFTEKQRPFWTTIGIGVKSQLSQNSSIYLDADTNLGNGYRNTYQLNLGVNIKF